MRVHSLWNGHVGFREGRSVLLHSFHQSPLKVAKPFAGEGGELLLYLMDSSPGLFNGDTQEIDCTLQRGASLFLTNQASCKLHPSLEGCQSRQIQRFSLQEGAVLEYFPEPLIPLAGADHLSEIIVSMETGTQAFIGEILTPGRMGHGERFQYKRVASQFHVYWQGKLIAWDSLLLEPSQWKFTRGIMEEYTHIGTLWVLSESIGKHHVSMIQELLQTYDSAIYPGVSMLARNGLVIRILGHSAWSLQAVIHDCWDKLRRELLGKQAFQVRK